MKRIILFPYQTYSESCRNLADEIGGTIVRTNGTYRPRQNDLIVNWGNSHIPNWINLAVEAGAKMLNNPIAVSRATNKLSTFRALENAGVPIPEYTTDRITANDWDTIVTRNTLNGNSGEGIVLVGEHESVPHAPLYTKFIPQKSEYRVHVFNDEIISYAKKQRESDNPPENDTQNMIRSHNNGWIFRKEGLRRLERVETIARNAISALGLDFGGVDVVMDESGKVYVLEVNSAVGMVESTLEAYKNKILEYAK